MTEEDIDGRPQSGGEPVAIELDGVSYDVCMVASEPDRLRPLLQRDRQPDPLVHPALPLGPLQRPGHPPGGDRGLGGGIQGRQRRHRRGGAARHRGPGRAAGDAPRLPPLHLPGPDPRGPARRLPPVLRPHPLVPAGLLAHPAQPLARGDLPQHAGQRHHRLPHHRLLPQLPAVLPRAAGAGDRLRARRGALRGPARSGFAPTPSRSTPTASTGRPSPPRSRSTSRSCCAAAATT